MIYAMSDIHGCDRQLAKNLQQVDWGGDNCLILLGDYIDYGGESGEVLHRIYDLQKQYGNEKVVVLKGNHEAMLLEWIHEYRKKPSAELEALAYDSWLKTDSMQGFNTFRTLVPEKVFEEFDHFCRKASFIEMNVRAVSLLLDHNRDIVVWLTKLPSFYETVSQIFVHAGVDEEAEEYWKWGTGDDMFLWKHPASYGPFVKTVVAGHIGTGGLAHDEHFHDVYFDGDSHYYIDGSVYKGGKLLLLGYDANEDAYFQIEDGKMVAVKKFRFP